MFNLTNAIKIAVVTEEGRAWPTFDGGNLTRWKYLSASEASRCVRSLAFDKNHDKNATPVEDYWDQFSDEEFTAIIDGVGTDDMRGIFARGNAIEEWVVQQLRAVEGDDELMLYLGSDQRSFYNKKHRISGTPDGVYVNLTTDEMWLLEFKSTQNRITQPRAAHLTQVQANMGLIQALRSEGLLTDEMVGVKLPEKFSGAKLLYIGTDNYLDLQEFDIPYDDGMVYHKMRAKARALYDGKDLRKPEDLAPEGLSTNGCFFCRKKDECRAIESHRKDTVNAKKLREIIDKSTGKGGPVMPEFKADLPRDEVVNLLAQYDQFSESEKRAKAQKEALRDAIKVWCEHQEDTKAEFEDDGTLFKVTLSKSVRKGSLDRGKIEALLAAMHKDVKEYSGKDSAVETLRVTVKKLA